jgi:2-amino-4-hydroxy-6-hydroxymethyldihydropteridine diphosphokinase
MSSDLANSVDCLIGIGANLGDRHKSLEVAIQLLCEDDQIVHVATSTLRESAPVGGPDSQSTYLNGAIHIRSKHSPEELLKRLLTTEQQLGRQRDKRWGPRTVDLDLLLYGDQHIDQTGLEVPHPWMTIRRFVMEPSVELAPDWIHPRIGWSLERLWNHLRNCRPLIAVAGLSDAQSPLLTKIAENFQAKLISARESGFPSGPISAKNENSVLNGSESIKLHDAMVNLVRKAVHSTKSMPILCDFWWESPLAFHKSATPLAEFAADLLIVIAPTANDDPSETWRQRLVQRATRPQLGPFLRVSSDDETRMTHDISAAIEGMLN